MIFSNHDGSLLRRQPGVCIHERKASFAQEVVEQAAAEQVERPSNRLQGVSWQHQLGAHKAKIQTACLCPCSNSSCSQQL